MIEIHSITDVDLPRLAILLEQLSEEKSDPVKMIESYRRIAGDDGYILLGAFVDGALAGSLMGIVCHDLVGECRPFMVIENVIVAEECRGKGIGKTLIEAIEKEGRKRNCSYTMFVSGIKRIGAHAFYESAGYAPDMVRGFKKYL
ncbi:MAG TPA: GNAT family N-acetyltransferase [Spirochaetota bacterium]|nr:GNAT family N-acetyltransferase [Spirochaetota bacterium]